MGSTYYSLHYHWVCSTKERRPFIQPDWRPRLHEYLGGTIRGLAGVPLKIGERVIGVLNVTDDARAGPFDEEEIRLASLFADMGFAVAFPQRPGVGRSSGTYPKGLRRPRTQLS